jgi:hypothetical protein
MSGFTIEPAARAQRQIGDLLDLAARRHTMHALLEWACSVLPSSIARTRIIEILPILRLFGNVGLASCAFSCARQVYLSVTADAARFPDLDVLMEGMERDWLALLGDPVAEPVPA